MSQRPAWFQPVKNFVLITVGILSAGMGLKGFLLSSHFIDGGVTGVSMLMADLFGLPLAALIPAINLPFIILGYRQIGGQFALKSAVAIAGLSLCIVFVPYPDVTPDLLLTAIFGGFFLGLGIGLAMRGGAVLDGTEIAALLISRSSNLLKVSDVILLLNVFIFGAAAFFLTLELALYSIITYFAASKMIDFLVHGLEEYTAVMIVSPKHPAIQVRLTDMGWGVTVIAGQQGYGKQGARIQAHDVLYTVITRLEIGRLKAIINEIDPDAFVTQHGINDVSGGKVKSLPLH
ncbi:YitT family protein [Spirosoma rigui]|uniref:YitT family protein n=1 Tax=Spirosoma rigui TaxID=564064 RepID=UPI0009AFCC1D|nr:YitT family protein [Spirosoma rigui]